MRSTRPRLNASESRRQTPRRRVWLSGAQSLPGVIVRARPSQDVSTSAPRIRPPRERCTRTVKLGARVAHGSSGDMQISHRGGDDAGHPACPRARARSSGENPPRYIASVLGKGRARSDRDPRERLAPRRYSGADRRVRQLYPSRSANPAGGGISGASPFRPNLVSGDEGQDRHKEEQSFTYRCELPAVPAWSRVGVGTFASAQDGRADSFRWHRSRVGTGAGYIPC